MDHEKLAAANISEEIRERLLQKLDTQLNRSDEEVLEMIEEEILDAGKKKYLPLAEKDRLRRELFYGIRKLDLLQEIMEDEEVTEIMVNGIICIEEKGSVLCGIKRKV